MSETIWAFDLGKGSIGEAVRRGNEFLHKESLLLPADFAETRTAAGRRRMMRTRQAHKAREAWLAEVMHSAGIEPLHGRRVTWNEATKKWETTPGDYRLEREFAPNLGEKTLDGAPSDEAGSRLCYTSCLLRIKLLRGERLEPWQIFKALYSAIQRRGYDPDIPWKNRQQRREEKKDDDNGSTAKRMNEFQKELERMAPEQPDYQWPCYFDAWKMGLWNPADPSTLKERLDCHAQSTRNKIVPRPLVEKEIRVLVESAAKQIPTLKDKANFLLFGPAQRPYASFYTEERKKHALREGGPNDWQGVVGQKIPRFDNRAIGKCILIPRLNVCKIRKDDQGKLHPKSIVAAEVVFLMKMKNMRLQTPVGVTGLTAGQIAQIYEDPKRTKLALTPARWANWCKKFGGQTLPGQFEEVKEPSFSGRCSFCRPALEIIKRLLLSGDTPAQAHAKELSSLQGNTNPMKGLVPDDLKFLLQMGATWEGLYIPNQKLEALTRSTENPQTAIRQLIGTQNDPIVRHRLSLFAERLDVLAEKFGKPALVVLEFVREDFMGKKARAEYLSFQRKRAEERKLAREDAEKAGATERAAGLKMELLTAQKGICLYTGDPLVPTELDQYVIDHIVPRAKNGPDAAVNYVLTTQRTNDEKLDRTPYEWLRATPDWDAYVHRVKERIGTLRNKKAQLLTSPEAETLVEKYTALAETAWISKLAQTIIGLRFGWPGGIEDGKRRVIVVSGGLTGRIRRKYKLNSLLNPTAANKENAEQKNRNDNRHHALDAMVISFLPNWARNAATSGFFKFPEGVDRNLFAKAIAEVIPQNICFEKPALAETIYGARKLDGEKIIVQRVELVSLAMKPTAPGKTVFDLKYAQKKVQAILDPMIREKVAEFINALPDEAAWKSFCSQFRITNKDSRVGPLVGSVTMNIGDAQEYKEMSKDGSGAYRKALKGHKGQIVYLDDKGQARVCPVYAFESIRNKLDKLRIKGSRGSIIGVFKAGCTVELKRPIQHSETPLIPGRYLLNTIRTDAFVVITDAHGKPSKPINLAKFLEAGFQRVE